MTRRDLAWRAAGGALLALSCAAILVGDGEGGGATPEVILPAFNVALGGAVLLIQGKRVALALRIERSRHRALPGSIHTRRRRQR